MGRLHRIGQHEDVYIYHLVAPATREGRVQEVMLDHLNEAGEALQGRIFDLLSATVDGLDFNYATALVQAQQSAGAGEEVSKQVPAVAALIARAKSLAQEEDRLRTVPDIEAARERFVADRLEAINPVIVEGFLHRLAATQGWHIQAGSATGIWRISAHTNLPAALGGGTEAVVSADGTAVRTAWERGVDVSQVIVLGPTEAAFKSLVELASSEFVEHLVRGVAVEDPTSLTDYSIFVWTFTLSGYDGVKPYSQRVPILVRYSGTEAFPMAWEAVLKLLPGTAPASIPSPGARTAAEATANQEMIAEEQQMVTEKRNWADKARADLEDIEARYQRQIASYSDDVRPQLRREFALQKAERLAQLDRITAVSAVDLQLVGWLHARGTASLGPLEWDPDSEKVAVAAVMAELSSTYEVDDRQTAGVGYDLFARHRRTGEVRLIEVKGLEGSLESVTLEQHEWAQAQQRRDDYWLYVVTNCAERPQIVLRIPDPAGKFASGIRDIQRFKIPASKLRSAMRGQ